MRKPHRLDVSLGLLVGGLILLWVGQWLNSAVIYGVACLMLVASLVVGLSIGRIPRRRR